MAKQNRPGAQKADSDNTQAEKQQQIQPASSASSTSKGKSGAKSRKPTIGGTAVQGAKSTQPKELSTASRNTITAKCAGACGKWAQAHTASARSSIRANAAENARNVSKNARKGSGI